MYVCMYVCMYVRVYVYSRAVFECASVPFGFGFVSTCGPSQSHTISSPKHTRNSSLYMCVYTAHCACGYWQRF